MGGARIYKNNIIKKWINLLKGEKNNTIYVSFSYHKSHPHTITIVNAEHLWEVDASRKGIASNYIKLHNLLLVKVYSTLKIGYNCTHKMMVVILKENTFFYVIPSVTFYPHSIMKWMNNLEFFPRKRKILIPYISKISN